MNQQIEGDPKCPECKEPLYSHAGRFWKLFHRHVIDGPYPNPDPHHCSLVNQMFNNDGTIVDPKVLDTELEEYRQKHGVRYFACDGYGLP